MADFNRSAGRYRIGGMGWQGKKSVGGFRPPVRRRFAFDHQHIVAILTPESADITAGLVVQRIGGDNDACAICLGDKGLCRDADLK